jgi:hypothetical protein
MLLSLYLVLVLDIPKQAIECVYGFVNGFDVVQEGLARFHEEAQVWLYIQNIGQFTATIAFMEAFLY